MPPFTTTQPFPLDLYRAGSCGPTNNPTSSHLGQRYLNMHLVRPILLQVFFSDVCQTPWPLGSRHYKGQTGEHIWNPGGVEFLQNKMECGRHERLHLTGKDDDCNDGGGDGSDDDLSVTNNGRFHCCLALSPIFPLSPSNSHNARSHCFP